jgi:predicted flap endonuclease-1-like 5' DNA nuclease
MDLSTVFIIISASLIGLIGILWLISWLTRSREEIVPVIPGVPVHHEVQAEREEPKTVTKSVEVTHLHQQPSDDLTVIEGIGPKISELLKDSGIMTYTQLAATQVIILEAILKEANLHIANPGTWPQQASLAADGKWDELRQLQDELQGGRQNF